MNNDTIERYILLQQSGELGPIRAWRLNRALSRSPEARRFASDLQRLTESARDWTVPLPGPRAAEAIHARLREASDRREVLAFQPPLRRRYGLAFATACALVLISLFFYVRPADRTATDSQSPTLDQTSAFAWDDGVDEEIDALLELVAITANEEPSLNGAAALDEDQLIREWLALEGIAI